MLSYCNTVGPAGRVENLLFCSFAFSLIRSFAHSLFTLSLKIAYFRERAWAIRSFKKSDVSDLLMIRADRSQKANESLEKPISEFPAMSAGKLYYHTIIGPAGKWYYDSCIILLSYTIIMLFSYKPSILSELCLKIQQFFTLQLSLK